LPLIQAAFALARRSLPHGRRLASRVRKVISGSDAKRLVELV